MSFKETCDTASDCYSGKQCCMEHGIKWSSYYSIGGYSQYYSGYGSNDVCDYQSGCSDHSSTPMSAGSIIAWILVFFIILSAIGCFVNTRKKTQKQTTVVSTQSNQPNPNFHEWDSRNRLMQGMGQQQPYLVPSHNNQVPMMQGAQPGAPVMQQQQPPMQGQPGDPVMQQPIGQAQNPGTYYQPPLAGEDVLATPQYQAPQPWEVPQQPVE